MENTQETTNNTDSLQNQNLKNPIVWKNVALQLSMVIAGLVLWLASFVFAFIYSIAHRLDMDFILWVLAVLSHLEGFIFIVCGCFVFAKLFNSNNLIVAKNIKEGNING